MESFKKGDYVVYLKDISGGEEMLSEGFPINTVYKLREEITPWKFRVERDYIGRNQNGYSCSKDSPPYKYDFRMATEDEMKMYDDANGPVKIKQRDYVLSLEINKINSSLEETIKILEKWKS